MSTALAVRPTPQTNDIDVAELLTAIVKHGVTSDAAGAVQQLVLLREHQEDRDAKRQWLEAFARVRNATKTINAGKAIPDRSGGVRWFYAPLEDLQDAIEPILELHDMTMRFDSRREGNLCHGICWVSHSAGHEEKSECAVNATNAQGGDLGAIKIAKRGAMTAIFGIKTRHMDDDASVLGDVVSAEQAEFLESRSKALGDDLHERFLTYIQKTCGTREFTKIRQGKFGVLDDALTRGERRKEAEAGPSPEPKPQVAKTTIDRVDKPAEPVVEAEHVDTATGEVTTRAPVEQPVKAQEPREESEAAAEVFNNPAKADARCQSAAKDLGATISQRKAMACRYALALGYGPNPKAITACQWRNLLMAVSGKKFDYATGKIAE